MFIWWEYPENIISGIKYIQYYICKRQYQPEQRLRVILVEIFVIYPAWKENYLSVTYKAK